MRRRGLEPIIISISIIGHGNRCLHLIRTASKEGLTVGDTPLLVPVGSGWYEAISFIKKHIQQLDNLRIPISKLLSDWEYRLLFQPIVGENEKLLVKGL